VPYNISNVFRDYKSDPVQHYSIYLYIYDYYKTQTHSLILLSWSSSRFFICYFWC